MICKSNIWVIKMDRPKSDRYHNHNAPKGNEKKLNRILNSMNLDPYQKTCLKEKLLEFLNAKNCTGILADIGFDGGDFIFTRENEYVKTTDEFIYLSGSSNDRRIFHDCYSSHSHDGLVNNPRFQDLIERTGMEFIECKGGFVTDYSMADDVFTFKDETEVNVYFKVGSKKRCYRLDLDRMELSKNYNEYDI